MWPERVRVPPEIKRTAPLMICFCLGLSGVLAGQPSPTCGSQVMRTCHPNGITGNTKLGITVANPDPVEEHQMLSFLISDVVNLYL